MPLGSNDDFNDDDLAILAEHGIDVNQQADDGETATTSEQANTADTQEQTATTTDATATATDSTTTDEPKGNVSQALRASRRAERRARDAADQAKQEAEKLRQELEALKGKQGKPGNSDDIDLDEIAEEFPAAAEAIKRERAAREEAERKLREQTPQTQVDPEFTPPEFPEHIQDLIDEVPKLLAWQHDPDQTKFGMAVAADLLLQNHPTWKDKPDAERFQEAVRRVEAELSDQAAQAAQDTKPAQPSAKELLARAPKPAPETLSSLSGATPSTEPASMLGRYAKMSDEEIEADLMRGG